MGEDPLDDHPNAVGVPTTLAFFDKIGMLGGLGASLFLSDESKRIKSS